MINIIKVGQGKLKALFELPEDTLLWTFLERSGSF